MLVAKYLDHLPLYRQERVFERAGMAIARSTLAQWVGECGVQLQPLVDALVAEMLESTVLHADETALKLFGELYDIERGRRRQCRAPARSPNGATTEGLGRNN